MSSDKLPLKSRFFFLDLPNYEKTNELIKDLELLGAKEVLLLSKATFVVTNRPFIKNESSPSTSFSGPRSNSPLFRDSSLGNASPFLNSPVFEQKHLNGKLKPMSRGYRMLKASEKSHNGSNKLDIIDMCKKHHIKIIHVQKVLHEIQKYKSKYQRGHYSNRSQMMPSVKVQTISSPLIKFEDAAGKFRPKYKTFLPKFFHSLLYKCTKTAVNLTLGKMDGNVRPVLHEISSISQVSTNEQCKTPSVSISKLPGCNSISNSISICGPSNAIKDEKENQLQANKKKEKKKSKKEFCEICHAHYTDGETHYETDFHKRYLNNSKNYQLVEDAISGFPSVQDFLEKLQKEDNQEEVIDDIQLFEDPFEPTSRENSSLKRFEDEDTDTCRTETYSLNPNEFISSSDSCPSTSLPYLEDKHAPPILSHYNNQSNKPSTIASKTILSDPPELIPCELYETHSMLYLNDASNVHGAAFSNSYAYSMYPDDGSHMNPGYAMSSVLDYSNKSTLPFDKCFRSSLCTPQENVMHTEMPLDLSFNLSGNNQYVSNNSVDIPKNFVNDDSNCVVGVIKVSDDNGITSTVMHVEKMSCSLASTAINVGKMSTDDSASLLTNDSNDNINCNSPKPNFVYENSTNAEQTNNSCNKLGDADNFSSESESDPTLNEVVASCIEEVDKNLQKESYTLPDVVNNQHLLSCTDVSLTKSPINECAVSETSMGDCLLAKSSLVPCQLDKLTRSLNVELFKPPVGFVHPPGKRAHFHLENTALCREPNNRLVEPSEVDEWDAMDPPFKRICFQAEKSIPYHQPESKLLNNEPLSMTICPTSEKTPPQIDSSVLINNQSVLPLTGNLITSSAIIHPINITKRGCSEIENSADRGIKSNSLHISRPVVLSTEECDEPPQLLGVSKSPEFPFQSPVQEALDLVPKEENLNIQVMSHSENIFNEILEGSECQPFLTSSLHGVDKLPGKFEQDIKVSNLNSLLEDDMCDVYFVLDDADVEPNISTSIYSESSNCVNLYQVNSENADGEVKHPSICTEVMDYVSTSIIMGGTENIEESQMDCINASKDLENKVEIDFKDTLKDDNEEMDISENATTYQTANTLNTNDSNYVENKYNINAKEEIDVNESTLYNDAKCLNSPISATETAVKHEQYSDIEEPRNDGMEYLNSESTKKNPLKENLMTVSKTDHDDEAYSTGLTEYCSQAGEQSTEAFVNSNKIIHTEPAERQHSSYVSIKTENDSLYESCSSRTHCLNSEGTDSCKNNSLCSDFQGNECTFSSSNECVPNSPESSSLPDTLPNEHLTGHGSSNDEQENIVHIVYLNSPKPQTNSGV